jgi:hypothetical protein
MKRFKDYLVEKNLSIKAEATSSFDDVEKAIDNAIDNWSQDLKKSLINPFHISQDAGEEGAEGAGTRRGYAKPSFHRSLWDRFKNTLSNLFYSRYHSDNPYKWQNALGDYLGQKVQKENFIPLPFHLEDYQKIEEIYNSLEQQINENDDTENLRLFVIINKKTQELKNIVKNIFKSLQQQQQPQTQQPPQTTQPAPEEPVADKGKIKVGTGGDYDPIGTAEIGGGNVPKTTISISKGVYENAKFLGVHDYESPEYGPRLIWEWNIHGNNIRTVTSNRATKNNKCGRIYWKIINEIPPKNIHRDNDRFIDEKEKEKINQNINKLYTVYVHESATGTLFVDNVKGSSESDE